jgi:hypothetical protein
MRTESAAASVKVSGGDTCSGQQDRATGKFLGTEKIVGKLIERRLILSVRVSPAKTVFPSRRISR